jgi:L-ascorbate metabolism protein UlaG (beta-lactamase superfamily)
MILTTLKYFGIFVVFVFALSIILNSYFKSPGWHGPVSNHFDGKKFFNIKDPNAPVDKRSGFEVLKWLLSRDGNEWVEREGTTTIPVQRVMGREIVATFINHASVLIQTQGLNIITDPMYAERASPVSWTGPHRYTKPGITWDALPPIDIVMVSHNHYDHMDIGTLKKLQERFHPVILAPLGNKEFLKKKGITATELDWWSTYALPNNISITLVPAQHFSARALSDRDTSLWGGYVIGAPEGDIYFAGDTGYGPFVDTIKKNYPKGFRLGLLPIGAFKPEWFMGEVHISPAESLKIAKELSIDKVMAIHFGTFKLADDKQDEPVETLEALKAAQANNSFIAVPNGGTVRVK